jgi:hypothetical protein
MDYFDFQKDLERFNLIDQFNDFVELLRSWEQDIFSNPYDVPIIYNKIILRLKTYPTNLQPILLRHLLEYRKTCNRSVSVAWEYLERYYSEMGKTQNQEPPPATDQEPGNEKQSPDLSINQIALKSVFEGLTINRENANEIVKRFGHNSGEKLFQRFSYYSSYTNRTGKEITSKKFKNKIELFESVIELLPNANKQRAIIELKGLKILFENEFE